jgi:hypothetical protein
MKAVAGWRVAKSTTRRRESIGVQRVDRLRQRRVRQRLPFVRYFKTMQRLNTPPSRRGVKGGSDGTRTRDLRRDRPAF